MKSYAVVIFLLFFTVAYGPPHLMERVNFSLCGIPIPGFQIGCMAEMQLGNNDLGGQIVATVLMWLGQLWQAIIDNVVTPLIDQLPDAGDLGIPSLSGMIVGYAWMNTFLPLDTGVQVAGILLAAMVGKFAWASGVMLYHLIPKPFSGT